MHFQPTQPSEATAIYNILDACRTDMLNRGIQQWDETYPTLEMVKKDISTGGMYTIIQDDELIGAIVMDEKQSPQYASVNWKLKEEPILVIHRLAINPNLHGGGLGKQAMNIAHQFTAENNYKTIRLDAYKGNVALINFYNKLGYQAVGEIPLEYTAGPFVCFERSI
jgi:ribosomal protein S18 acetylase RimI-like enzyme